MLPCDRSSIVQNFKSLFHANLFGDTEKCINHRARLDICIQSFAHRAIRCIITIQLPNAVDLVVTNYDGRADRLDKMPAGRTVMLSALTKNVVGSSGKAAQVCLPKNILVYISPEHRCGILNHCIKMILYKRFKIVKFHFCNSFLLYVFDFYLTLPMAKARGFLAHRGQPKYPAVARRTPRFYTLSSSVG